MAENPQHPFGAPTPPEYEIIARDMAAKICDFEPLQRNQMLLAIREVVTKRLQAETEDATQRLQYLNDCFKAL